MTALLPSTTPLRKRPFYTKKRESSISIRPRLYVTHILTISPIFIPYFTHILPKFHPCFTHAPHAPPSFNPHFTLFHTYSIHIPLIFYPYSTHISLIFQSICLFNLFLLFNPFYYIDSEIRHTQIDISPRTVALFRCKMAFLK